MYFVQQKFCREGAYLRVFSGNNNVPEQKKAYLLTNVICFDNFVILANAHLNLKPTICKIAI